MALRATPTIAICLVAGVATGIALTRPDDASTTADTRYESSGAASGSSGESLDLSYGDTPADGREPDDAGTDAVGDEASGGGRAAGAPAAITIADFDFSGETAVAPGATIEVTNLDGATHTLTSDDDLFDTNRLGKDATATIAAPDTPGTYGFFCVLHPSMRGELQVG